MTKGRLEAFSDGVIAVIITIMVLELKAPEGAGLARLTDAAADLLTYVLSFVFLGIYWNNHHHLLHATERIGGRVDVGQPAPAVLAVAGAVRHRLDGRAPRGGGTKRAVYGIVLLMCGIAYTMLLAHASRGARRQPAAGRRGRQRSERNDVAAALSHGIGLAYVNQWISDAIYVAVALMWLIPDRRIENELHR